LLFKVVSALLFVLLKKRKNPREKEVRKPGGAVNVAMMQKPDAKPVDAAKLRCKNYRNRFINLL